MPVIIVFGALFALIGVQNHDLDIQKTKINELCTQKFQSMEDIEKCKIILMKN